MELEKSVLLYRASILKVGLWQISSTFFQPKLCVLARISRRWHCCSDSRVHRHEAGWTLWKLSFSRHQSSSWASRTSYLKRRNEVGQLYEGLASPWRSPDKLRFMSTLILNFFLLRLIHSPTSARAFHSLFTVSADEKCEEHEKLKCRLNFINLFKSSECDKGQRLEHCCCYKKVFIILSSRGSLIARNSLNAPSRNPARPRGCSIITFNRRSVFTVHFAFHECMPVERLQLLWG